MKESLRKLDARTITVLLLAAVVFVLGIIDLQTSSHHHGQADSHHHAQ